MVIVKENEIDESSLNPGGTVSISIRTNSIEKGENSFLRPDMNK